MDSSIVELLQAGLIESRGGARQSTQRGLADALPLTVGDPVTEQLLVEKRSHPADVFPADGRVIEAVVFVSEYAQSHGGPQTVKDLIDEPGHVVPALDADGEFLLIQKDAISAMPSLRPTRIWTDTGTKLR